METSNKPLKIPSLESNVPTTEQLKPRARKNTLYAAVFAVVSLLGFLDASYLTLEHFRGTIPPCTIAHGCATVLTSSYSTIAGIPVALLGVLYYLAILVGTIVYLDTKNDIVLKRVAQATILGLLASLYFFGLQWLVIKAWCQYCLVSITTSTLLFIHGCYVLRKSKSIV